MKKLRQKADKTDDNQNKSISMNLKVYVKFYFHFPFFSSNLNSFIFF